MLEFSPQYFLFEVFAFNQVVCVKFYMELFENHAVATWNFYNSYSDQILDMNFVFHRRLKEENHLQR